MSYHEKQVNFYLLMLIDRHFKVEKKTHVNEVFTKSLNYECLTERMEIDLQAHCY